MSRYLARVAFSLCLVLFLSLSFFFCCCCFFVSFSTVVVIFVLRRKRGRDYLTCWPQLFKGWIALSSG